MTLADVALVTRWFVLSSDQRQTGNMNPLTLFAGAVNETRECGSERLAEELQQGWFRKFFF